MLSKSPALTPEECNEPVYYCKSCHSLCILVDEDLANEDWDGSYCGKCHSADVGVCTFGEWLAEEAKIEERRRIAEWNK